MFGPKPLDAILGGFDKIHKELQLFLEHHSGKESEKKVEVEKLNAEIETHQKEQERAKKVSAKIKEFTSF